MAKPPIPVAPMMYPVTLDFTPGAPPVFTFGGCMEDDELTVAQALAMIVIHIQTDRVTFPESSPVVWTGEVPTCMTVSRDSDTQVTIVNWNSNRGADGDSYGFQVIVQYEGVSYLSHDPTIINATIPTFPECEEDGETKGGYRRVKREAAALRAV